MIILSLRLSGYDDEKRTFLTFISIFASTLNQSADCMLTVISCKPDIMSLIYADSKKILMYKNMIQKRAQQIFSFINCPSVVCFYD